MSLRGGNPDKAEAICFKTRLLRVLRTLAMTSFAFFLFFTFFASPVHASEWAKNNGYWGKTGGKFVFGLKYIVFSFFEPWLESNEPEYKREWEGFCIGLGKGFVFEAAGLIHLVTFPIPVDIPDVGIGMHLPNKDCPMRHDPKWKLQKPDSKKDLK